MLACGAIITATLQSLAFGTGAFSKPGRVLGLDGLAAERLERSRSARVEFFGARFLSIACSIVTRAVKATGAVRRSSATNPDCILLVSRFSKAACIAAALGLGGISRLINRLAMLGCGGTCFGSLRSKGCAISRHVASRCVLQEADLSLSLCLMIHYSK